MKLLQEFKAFAFKGNMIDLAVAVVIGGAFSKVITSIVQNVIMPIISYVTPDMNFAAWQLGKIQIGLLLNDLISFVLIAAAVFFCVVKIMGMLMKKKEELPVVAPPTKDQELLMEIRDLLKKQ